MANFQLESKGDVQAIRKPLNGYQKENAFNAIPISIESNHINTCDINHFVMLSIEFNTTQDLDLNGVWNQVLSRQKCNRGETNREFAIFT